MDKAELTYQLLILSHSSDGKFCTNVGGSLYYTHEDPEVKQGIRKRGEEKEGSHLHAQLIVNRKTADNGRLISPMTYHRRSNAGHNQKFGQFERLNLQSVMSKLVTVRSPMTVS